MAKVIFSFNGIQTSIQCFKEDKMATICKKFATKIDADINSLYFLYGGIKINLDLSFDQLANPIDKSSNSMNILVYQFENEQFICPKCGEKMKFDKKLIDGLTSSNNDMSDTLEGLKIQVQNIMNDIVNNKSINYIKSQLKNINIIINNAISELKKNEERISQLTNFTQTNDIIKKPNVILGVLDI